MERLIAVIFAIIELHGVYIINYLLIINVMFVIETLQLERNDIVPPVRGSCLERLNFIKNKI